MIDGSPASSATPFDTTYPVVAPVPPDSGRSPRRSRRANVVIAAIVVLAALVVVGLVVTLFSGAVFGAGAAGGCGGG